MEEEELQSTADSGLDNTENERRQPKTNYPEGNWKRLTSCTNGEYLKIEDEMETVSRGGNRVKMVKSVSFHVLVIPIGELDEYGKDLLDAMLESERDHINDIVDYFQTYIPHPGMTFNKKAWKDARQAEVDKEREEEMIKLREMMKEKMEKMMDRQESCMDELNLEDPDFERVPFMVPEYKNHTFKEWFKILYSICDPKGLTDDQCVEVMEISMGGSYLTELENMKREKYSLKKIQKHFVEKDIVRNVGYTFDLLDPDFKKVPFMDPENKNHTFEEWFEILYSICDPKGLTDDQCVDVMEVCLLGVYGIELQEMKKKKYSLGMIEKHFLRKDITLESGCIFNENDPDFKKIPFMHPDKKENSFKDFFESLYSVCDPKGFSDAQCTEVMELRMGEAFLNELNELKNNSADLDTIELHFLAKDSQKGAQKEKVEKKKIKKDSKINMINNKVPESQVETEDAEIMMVPLIEPENINHKSSSKEKEIIAYPVCSLDENKKNFEMNKNKLGEELEELKDIVLHVLSKDVQENEPVTRSLNKKTFIQNTESHLVEKVKEETKDIKTVDINDTRKGLHKAEKAKMDEPVHNAKVQRTYPDCKVSAWYDYMNTALHGISERTEKQPLKKTSAESIPKGKPFKFTDSNKFCGSQIYCITLWHHYNHHDILYRSPFHAREMSSCLGEY